MAAGCVMKICLGDQTEGADEEEGVNDDILFSNALNLLGDICTLSRIIFKTGCAVFSGNFLV